MTNTGMLSSSPQTDPYFYYKLRNQLPPDSPLHATYGPLEHGQAMQEMVSRDPLSAIPLGLVGIPGYTLGKATGMIRGARSPASAAEMIEAYKGLLRGLFPPQPAPQQEPPPAQLPGGAYPGRNPPSFVRG